MWLSQQLERCLHKSQVAVIWQHCKALLGPALRCRLKNELEPASLGTMTYLSHVSCILQCPIKSVDVKLVALFDDKLPAAVPRHH